MARGPESVALRGIMDTNEIIALGIVAVAALLALRCFLKNKDAGCGCGTDCSTAARKEQKKK